MNLHSPFEAVVSRRSLERLLAPGGLVLVGFDDDRAAVSTVVTGFTGHVETLVGRDVAAWSGLSARPVDIAFLARGTQTRDHLAAAAAAGVALVVLDGADTTALLPDGDPSDLVAFGRSLGIAVVSRAEIGIFLPRSGLALPHPAGPRLTGATRGRVALIASAREGANLLAQAALDHAVGIAAALTFPPGGALDPAGLVEVLLADETVGAIGLDLDPSHDPHGLLAAASRAQASGVPLVLLRPTSAAVLSEIRPGISRLAAIEAALGARGVVFAETPASAVILAETASRRREAEAGSALTIRVVGDDARLAERLRAALAARPAVDDFEVSVNREDRSGSPSIEETGTVLTLIGDDGANLARRAELARTRRAHLTRIEDVLDVLDGLAATEAPHRVVSAEGEIEADLEIELSHLPNGELDIVQATDLAAAAGIRCLPFVTVKTGAEAVARALDIGFPVAAKVIGRAITDKSDAGGVTLAIGRLKDLRRAVSQLHLHFGETFVGALLQPHVGVVSEVEVGAFHDADWGGFVFLRSSAAPTGAGPVVAPAPLDAGAARRLLAALRARAPFETVPRLGGPDAGESVIDAIVAVGDLVGRLGEHLADFALHPLAVTAEGGAVALDVRARLRPVESPAHGDVHPPRTRSDLRRATFPPSEPLQRQRRSSPLTRL